MQQWDSDKLSVEEMDQYYIYNTWHRGEEESLALGINRRHKGI